MCNFIGLPSLWHFREHNRAVCLHKWALVAWFALAVPAGAATLEDMLHPLMDRDHVPGVSAAVLRDGALAEVVALGVADRRSGHPVDADTVFQAASISKVVTGLVAMRLAGEGRIGLDDPVVRTVGAWVTPPDP